MGHKAGGMSSSDMAGSMKSQAAEKQAKTNDLPDYSHGGRVKKTGLARVHKGEEVIPRHKAKRMKGRKRSR